MLRLNLCSSDVQLASDVDIPSIATDLDGYSGADIAHVCRDAAMMSMRRRIHGLEPQQIKELANDLDMPITLEDIRTALKKIRKTVADGDVDKYVMWIETFGAY